MLNPDEIERIKGAIARAQSVEDIQRLELALESGDFQSIIDLLPPSTLLADLWEPAQPKPLLVQNLVVPPRSAEMSHVRKTGRDEREDGHLKRRMTEGKHCESVLLDKIYPILHARQPPVVAVDASWIPTLPEISLASKSSVVVIEVGTALCISDGLYDSNVLVRLVVLDFLTESVLLDLEVSPDKEAEVVDIRPNWTGLAEVSLDTCVSFKSAQSAVLSLIDQSTLCLSSNPARCMQALQITHPKWISLNGLFQVDMAKKKQGESKFHVRNVLSVAQVLEAFLGEASYDRLKVLDPRERMVENCVGFARLVKQSVVQKQSSSFPIVIDCPRRRHAIFLSHIPPDWSEAELAAVMPKAVEIEPIDFQLDPSSNQWRGESVAIFKNEPDLLAAFSRLTTCTDMFVGWEWDACGKVSETTLKDLGSEFGIVVGVRIPEKYLDMRITAPNRDLESRPFGFISMARYQDAVSMAKEPRMIEGNGLSFHVKISQKPISAFKRVPLGEGEDYIEAFVM